MSVLLRFGRHDEVLTLPQPAADRPVMTAWWHFARGVALARTGKIDEAVAERAALDADDRAGARIGALRRHRSGERTEPSWRWRSSCSTRVWRGHGAPAGRHPVVDAAVAAADRLAYDEPPVWFYPVRESLGAALLAGGQPSEAERVFREDLERHPRNARSLFGLHESLVRQGKDADAAWVQRAFDEAWKNADVMLTLNSL